MGAMNYTIYLFMYGGLHDESWAYTPVNMNVSVSDMPLTSKSMSC